MQIVFRKGKENNTEVLYFISQGQTMTDQKNLVLDGVLQQDLRVCFETIANKIEEIFPKAKHRPHIVAHADGFVLKTTSETEENSKKIIDAVVNELAPKKHLAVVR